MFQNNALVEVALALAMAFFSIMVLAMVSMGVSDDSSRIAKTINYPISAEILLRHSTSKNENSSNTKGIVQITREEVIIYFQDKFFDTDLKELHETDLKRRSVRFLAVDPSIPTVEAANARKRFSSKTIVVTLLSDNWLKILKEKLK